jgi:hypothetical protein
LNLDNIQKVICIKNTREIDGEVFTEDRLQVGKIYDMQRILYTDDNTWNLWDCYIHDGEIFIVPLDFFEHLDEWRDKQLNKVINGDRTNITTEWDNRINS